jgi:hypothetical protein
MEEGCTAGGSVSDGEAVGRADKAAHGFWLRNLQ